MSVVESYYDLCDEHNKDNVDTLVLMQIGSFFEAYENESGRGFARKVSELLNMNLTKKNKNKEGSPFMCGFPSSHLPKHLTLLNDKGYRVAIYEQDENPYTSEGFIGDAKLLSKDTNVAPAWKVISLQNTITSSISEDRKNKFKIPQINITASYTLNRKELQDLPISTTAVSSLTRTNIFSDGKIINLTINNPMIYFEELNTELLTENFDIEVFEVVQGSPTDQFRRLFFNSGEPQIVNGMLMSPQPALNTQTLTTSSVEYYFSLLKDSQIDPEIACKHAEQFNSENYLIDLDFECNDVDGEDIYFDIYGRVTESEICPD